MKLLLAMAAIFVVLAFVLRAIIPATRFFPGGWPLGSHWYRANWLVFWFFLVAGIVVGVAAIFKVALRGQALR